VDKSGKDSSSYGKSGSSKSGTVIGVGIKGMSVASIPAVGVPDPERSVRVASASLSVNTLSLLLAESLLIDIAYVCSFHYPACLNKSMKWQ